MRAFLFYIDDWLSSKSVSMMDAEEERGYLRLLLAAASEPDCGVPNDDNWLATASLLGAQWFRPTRTKLKRIGGKTSGQKLRAKFVLRGDRLFNERLLEEWEHQQEVREKRREAGVKGGRPKKQTVTEEEPNAIANGLANDNQTAKQKETNDVCVLDFDLSSETTENTEVLKEVKDFLDERFEEFWQHAWRKAGKIEARKSYKKKATNLIIIELILKSVIRDEPIYRAREVEHRPHMSTWLNQERYNDEEDAPLIPSAKPNDLSARMQEIRRKREQFL